MTETSDASYWKSKAEELEQKVEGLAQRACAAEEEAAEVKRLICAENEWLWKKVRNLRIALQGDDIPKIFEIANTLYNRNQTDAPNTYASSPQVPQSKPRKYSSNTRQLFASQQSDR